MVSDVLYPVLTEPFHDSIDSRLIVRMFRLSVCLSNCLFVCLSVCLFVCLSVRQSETGLA